MTTLLTRPLRRLAETLADLRARVREALAGEIAGAVAEAVREVVATAVRGGPADDPPDSVPPRPAPDRFDEDPDPWDDRPGWRDQGYDPDPEPDGFDPPAAPCLIARPPAGPAAVTAGLAAGRWWLRRRGSVLEAVGVGVLVALAVFAGGPLAHAGAAVAATAADLTAATDALGAGAARLGQL